MNREAILNARIVYYRFFSLVFSCNLKDDHYPEIRELMGILARDPVDDATADALDRINRFLDTGGFDALKQENDAVFFSPTTTFLPTTASFYAEKRDDGGKRLEMLTYVQQSPYRRNSSEFKENEDHIEFILLFMLRLISDEVEGDIKSGELAGKVFTHILNAMLDAFCTSLQHHEKSRFYRDVATVLRTFIEFERVFLDVETPKEQRHRELVRPSPGKEGKPTRRIVQRNPDGYGCI